MSTSSTCHSCGKVEPRLHQYPHPAVEGARLCYPCEKASRPPLGPTVSLPGWDERCAVPSSKTTVVGVDSFTVGGASAPEQGPRDFDPEKYAAARDRAGKTNADVGAAVERSPNWIKKAVKGERCPTPEEVEAIAKFLGVPVDGLTTPYADARMHP